MEKQAEELTPQDYLNKVKAAYDIKQSLETLFVVWQSTSKLTWQERWSGTRQSYHGWLSH